MVVLNSKRNVLVKRSESKSSVWECFVFGALGSRALYTFGGLIFDCCNNCNKNRHANRTQMVLSRMIPSRLFPSGRCSAHLHRLSHETLERYRNSRWIFAATTCSRFSSSRASNRSAVAVDTKASKILLMLGKPGGGKGTISSKILQDFPRFHHISTGDSLRQHVQEATPVGLKAKAYMDSGKLVPDDVMIEVVMEDATPLLESGESLLLDGFPRTLDQAKSLNEVARIDIVVNLDIPTETIVDRIADRWIHPGSGRIYSYSYKPPNIEGKDDETGEPLVQRDDDQPDAVRKRLKIYDDMTAPLVEYYSRRPGVLKTFSGTMSDVIYPEVKQWLESKNC